MKLFLCYNRDELLKDSSSLNANVFLIANAINGQKEYSIYFDDLKNDGNTIPSIFERIEGFIDNDTIFLFIGESIACYGWAHEELKCAFEKGCEIRRISPRKFLCLIKHKNTFKKIIKKSKKLMNKCQNKGETNH